MTAQVDPLASLALQVRTMYYKMEPSEKLSVLLRDTHFVEFPTIEVWEEFRGMIVDAQGRIAHQGAAERKPKRRKLDPKAGKKTITGLIGGYGSEDDDEAQETNVFSALDDYAGSGDDPEEQTVLEEDASDTDDGDVTDPGLEVEQYAEQDEEQDEDLKLEPTALLELIRQVRRSENIAADDQVDWGDSDEEPE
jgi:hypothetical protein